MAPGIIKETIGLELAHSVTQQIVELALDQIYSNEIDKLVKGYGIDRTFHEISWIMEERHLGGDKGEAKGLFSGDPDANNTWMQPDEPKQPPTDFYIQNYKHVTIPEMPKGK